MSKETKKLDKNVILAGFTSFFTDISSEMIYPLIQSYTKFIMALKAGLVGPILGVIEGIAESTASLTKVFSGYISDKVKKRKPFAIAGYSLSGIAKLLYIFAPISWIFILIARFFDRLGKGIRTAPRDAIISESVDKSISGKAFGFHRAMDFAGAMIGTIITYFIVAKFIDITGTNLIDVEAYKTVFLLSLIPAFIGVIFLFFLKEKGSFKGKERPKITLSIKGYDKRLKLFFLATFFFTLGNSSNQFLLLRSVEISKSLKEVVLMYITFNLATTMLSTYFGKLSDRIGKKPVLITGYLLYSIVYLFFGFIKGNASMLWGFWILYGVYYALTEGVEKAFVSDYAPSHLKATALGMFHTIVGIMLLPASIIAGILYKINSAYPFIFGSIMSIIAVIILVFVKREIIENR